MQSLRSARWLVLALVVLMAAVAQQALSQIPAGTTRTGTFVWDGARWIPAEAAPAPVAMADPNAVVADTAPPALPVEVQPPPPAPDLFWTPGYWHFGLNGFYWVPGAWVPAPHPGLLWTPGYWGWTNGRYYFHEGYWGPHIGYYGGVNYGFGFGGVGFAGGEWRGGHFFYNTAVIHIDVNDRRFGGFVFEDHERVNRGIVVNPGHVAFAGGPGGIHHDPTPDESRAMKESHMPPSPVQKQHVEAAKADKTSYAKANGGHPAAAAKPQIQEKHAPEPMSAPKAEPKAMPKAEPKAMPKAEPKAAPKAEPKAEPKAMPKAEPKAMPKAEPKAEPKAAPKAEPKAAPKAEPKAQPKAEPKPVAKPANKPAPKEEPKKKK